MTIGTCCIKHRLGLKNTFIMRRNSREKNLVFNSLLKDIKILSFLLSSQREKKKIVVEKNSKSR